jgi:hypothetical protein
MGARRSPVDLSWPCIADKRAAPAVLCSRISLIKRPPSLRRSVEEGVLLIAAPHAFAVSVQVPKQLALACLSASGNCIIAAHARALPQIRRQVDEGAVWLWTALALCIVGGAVLAHENDGPPGTGDPNIDIFHAAAAVRTPRPSKTTWQLSCNYN